MIPAPSQHVFLRSISRLGFFTASCLIVSSVLFISSAFADEEGELWSLLPLNDGFVTAVTEDNASSVSSNSNPVDFWISQTLKDRGLSMSCPEDHARLLRRVSLDVTGLPPSPESIQQALGSSEDWDRVYEKWVDEALASPRYGERWAQHWLDVIRWAETVGFETNLARSNAWHYRDWVINAFNEDKPYDEFVFEQIAGDTLGSDAALGFLVAGPANLPGQIGRDEESMRQARQDELDETIRTVSQGILGLTVGCARCHDHKFDPISQKDYYSMQAVFAGLNYGDRRLRGEKNDRWAKEAEPLAEKLVELEKDYQARQSHYGLRPPLDQTEVEEFQPLRAKAVKMWIDASESNASASLYELEVWSRSCGDSSSSKNVALASSGAQVTASSFALENQTRHPDNLIDGGYDDRQDFPWRSGRGGPAWAQIDFQEPADIDRVVWRAGYSVPVNYRIEVQLADTDEWVEVAHTRDRTPRINDGRGADQVTVDGLTAEETKSFLELTRSIRQTRGELGRLQAGPQTYAAHFSEDPAPTWLLNRGDSMQRSEKVPPAAPEVIGDLGLDLNAPEVDRRVGLAKLMTEHPLPYRVIANRVWQHHFGRGLVDTPSDFGRQGSKPTHPELLDWMAAFLQENNGSLKALHKVILMSNTYRQSSQPKAEALSVDAESKWLWRYPPHRLEAEAIRDSILMVSGKINYQMGGPGFDFFNQRGGLSDYHPRETFDESGWRRMVYAHKIRMQSVDIFGALDCPDAGQMQPKRTRSITPIQALSLLNSPFILRQSQFLAERAMKEAPEDLKIQIQRCVKWVWLRDPNDLELDALMGLAQEHGLDQVARTLFNTSEFLYIQ